MKLLIQRVREASVDVKGERIAHIGPGLLVFIGITHHDTVYQVKWLTQKLLNLRLFEDEMGKMNRSLLDQKGSVLMISQFTLYADCLQGRRPSFLQAASPEVANVLYEQFISEVKKSGVSTSQGIFGANMQISLINDGPVTIMLEHNADGDCL